MIKIPKRVIKKNKKYILKKIYNNFALYEEIVTKTKTCFSFFELGLIKDNSHIMRGFKRNPQKVKYM